MLPDKEQWAKEFINSEQYKKITSKIRDLYELEFVPVWNVKDNWGSAESPRHHYYLLRALPLQCFYILDYISKETNGDVIVNVCNKTNMFEGIYNVVLWSELKEDRQLSVYDLYSLGMKFNNTICTSENSIVSFEHFKTFLLNYARLTKNYGYIAFDSSQMMLNTNNEFVQSKELFKYFRLMSFIDDVITSLSNEVDIIYYENHMDLEPYHDPVEGDIKILFKTKLSTKA